MVKPVKIKRRDFFVCVTRCKNSEVQIAVHVVSKWNMLRHWKLVLGFSVFVYLQPSMNTRYFDRLKGLWHASVHMRHLDFWSGEPFFKISIWWKNPLLSTLRRPRKLLYQYSRTIWSMFGSFKRHILYFNLVQALSRKFEVIEDKCTKAYYLLPVFLQTDQMWRLMWSSGFQFCPLSSSVNDLPFSVRF